MNMKQAFQDTKQDNNIYNVLPSTMNSSLEKKKRKKNIIMIKVGRTKACVKFSQITKSTKHQSYEKNIE